MENNQFSFEQLVEYFKQQKVIKEFMSMHLQTFFHKVSCMKKQK